MVSKAREPGSPDGRTDGVVSRHANPGRPPVARIDESVCIGCALCLEACPVDAIVGAAKRMHTVITEECTGCGWCLPPCPVDCIKMIECGEPWTQQTRRRRADQYRHRHRARQSRLETERGANRIATKDGRDEDRKRETVDRAMQRAAERLRDRGS